MDLCSPRAAQRVHRYRLCRLRAVRHAQTPSRGFVTRFLPELPDQYDEEKIRDISALLSDRPAVTEEQVKLAFEMKRRYYCTVGDALDTMVPPTVLPSVIVASKRRVLSIWMKRPNCSIPVIFAA